MSPPPRASQVLLRRGAAPPTLLTVPFRGTPSDSALGFFVCVFLFFFFCLVSFYKRVSKNITPGFFGKLLLKLSFDFKGGNQKMSC